jgi:hypothetical protein
MDMALLDGTIVYTPKPIPVPGYQELRRREYPAVGDQLDALWKMLVPPVGSEAETILASINAVKAKYPKP